MGETFGERKYVFFSSQRRRKTEEEKEENVWERKIAYWQKNKKEGEYTRDWMVPDRSDNHMMIWRSSY